MATATERIPVLVTPREKALIAEKAKAAGVSMGEFLRRGAASSIAIDDEKLLAGMIEQMLKSTESASRAIDDALDFIAASNGRLDALGAQHKAH